MPHPFLKGALFGIAFGVAFFSLATPSTGLMTADSPYVAFGKLVLAIIDVLATVISIISLVLKRLPRNSYIRGFVGFTVSCALMIHILSWGVYGFSVP